LQLVYLIVTVATTAAPFPEIAIIMIAVTYGLQVCRWVHFALLVA
jgi:hypothetical protein